MVTGTDSCIGTIDY